MTYVCPGPDGLARPKMICSNLLLRDDLCFMSLNDPKHKLVAIPSEAAETERLCKCLLDEAKANDFEKNDIFAIHLALEEAFINAVNHGNAHDPDKQINIEYLVTPEKFDIFITDQGKGFDNHMVPDPRNEENLYKSSGRGILLMRSYMDLVEYSETGNCVHMVKHKSDTKE